MNPIRNKKLYIFRGTLLRLRVTWNHGESLTLSTGYNVDREKWDGRRCLANTTHGKEKTPASSINRYLDNLESEIDRAFYTFEAQDTTPTKQQLKALVNPDRNKPRLDIYNAIDEFIRDGDRNSFWGHATGVKFRSKRHLLESYNSTARHKLEFGSINENSLNEFVNWQTSNCISKKKKETNYRNSTILKNISFLKWFLRWARKKGYLTERDRFEDYKPNLKTVEKNVIFLTWNELMKIYNHDFSGNKFLEIVRDGFCLSCFTSLRYSDLKNLKKANIIDGKINIVTIKTSDAISIELNKFALSILEKYKETESDYAIPVPSSQKMNIHLKEIGKICGIDQPISTTYLVGSTRHEETKPKYEYLTTHCARRTFICTALYLGIAPNTVMKWTGHSSYNSMKPYIAVADEMKLQSMEVFNNLPDGAN